MDDSVRCPAGTDYHYIGTVYFKTSVFQCGEHAGSISVISICFSISYLHSVYSADHARIIICFIDTG